MLADFKLNQTFAYTLLQNFVVVCVLLIQYSFLYSALGILFLKAL